jgi:YbbR domain-containing protein
MNLSFKNILATNLMLKVISFIAGFTLWLIISTEYPATMTLDIPLCFYGNHEHNIIDAPETIQVTLAGKKTDLYNLDLAHLALHYNSDELDHGEQLIPVTRENLFLPHTVKLVHLNPSNVVITVNEKARINV